MKKFLTPVLLFFLLATAAVHAQTTTVRDTTRVNVGDTQVVTVKTTTTTQTTASTTYTYPVANVTIEQYKVPLVTTPPPNVPPLVSAGNNSPVTLPVSTVTLSGSATDPDGKIVSSQWTKTSGGSATITNPTAFTTTVTGLAAGSYVFRLTATDNAAASAFASTNVTVNPAVIDTSVSNLVIQGFASEIKGGNAYKSTPTHVTNLNETGPGSLYEAMRSNRYIVFDVGGVIKNFRWDVGNSETGSYINITIDGTTAPSPGITLDNGTKGGNTFGFEGEGNHDIIIKGIRAINAVGGDNFHFVAAHDIALVNCTAYGAGDGNIDITNGAYNITTQYCIFGPGCQCTNNGSDRWSGNSLLAYGVGRITAHHCIYYSRTPGGIAERNALAQNYSGTVIAPVSLDFVSNVVYNWGRSNGAGSGYGTAFDYGSYGNVRNNYYYIDNVGGVPGNAVTESPYGLPKGTIYAIGNVSGNTGVNPNNKTAKIPYAIDLVNQVAEEDACTSLRNVLNNAGVRYNGQLVNAEELRIVNIIKAAHPGCQ